MDIINFQDSGIRTIEDDGDLWYSLIDVIRALTDSKNPRSYWNTLKHRLRKEGASETLTNCKQFKLIASDGKMRLTDCTSRENLLRVIQSIPSASVEPFKVWLANAGEQNIQETENPLMLMDKLKDSLRNKGYDEEWINARLRSLLVRDQLTTEWKNRGVKQSEYGILTNEIMKGTFDLSAKEYKILKGLVKENLRDNMSNMELIFTMLGEETARTLSVKKDAQGFQENRETAIEGGKLAGESRERLEKKIGMSVINKNNHLDKGSSK